MPKSLGDEWMSVLYASNYLGIVNRTLYSLIDSGQLPAYKFGRSSGCGGPRWTPSSRASGSNPGPSGTS